MLLWVTVLYNQDLGPKWLPCYLDMQNPYNLKLVYQLAEYERYPVIIFNLEPPHICANVLSSSIAPPQRQMLKNWVQQSQQLLPSNQAALSKKLLRQQYQQMQPQILNHLSALIK
jgi:serine/threonine-protein kinase